MKLTRNSWITIAVMAALMTFGGILFGQTATTGHERTSPQHRHFNLDGGLREISIDWYLNSWIVEIRDLRPCRNSPNQNTACHMTEYELDSSYKFISRNSHDFNHGLNVGTGEVVNIGNKEAHWQQPYGIGNLIPYSFHTYLPGSRTAQLEQKRVDAVLAELLPKT